MKNLSIEENLGRIFKTKKYSLPLNPNFGLSSNWSDKPLTAENKASIIEEITEQIRLFEPRLNIESIDVNMQNSTLTLTLNTDMKFSL